MESNSLTRNKNNFLKKAKEALEGTRFTQIEHVLETTSTNSDLVLRAAEIKENAVLVTEHQTDGRGRLGRIWEAPEGENLLCSLLLIPDWDSKKNPLVTSALAVSIVNVLSNKGMEALIKWPNDVVISGEHFGKLAGILSEYVQGTPSKVIVGFGLNVNWPNGSKEGPEGAVSLKMFGKNYDKWELLFEVLADFENQLRLLAAKGGELKLRQNHISLSATIGKLVRVDTPKKKIRGIAEDITQDGYLLINDGTNNIEVSSGDVINLRETNE
tara:strand:- start:3621 stop:4433 length:813 start_codon:yes stop_codon:yes gene_type:complete